MNDARAQFSQLCWFLANLWPGALALVLFAGMGAWRIALESRVTELAQQALTLEMRWRTVSTQLQEAQEAEPVLKRLLVQPKTIAAERENPRWTATLRSVVLACPAQAELQSVQAQEKPEANGECELRIQGIAVGQTPRITAERFRQTLIMHLEHISTRGSVRADFEQLEDAAEGSENAQRGAAFTIVATAQVQPAGATDPR